MFQSRIKKAAAAMSPPAYTAAMTARRSGRFADTATKHWQQHGTGEYLSVFTMQSVRRLSNGSVKQNGFGQSVSSSLTVWFARLIDAVLKTRLIRIKNGNTSPVETNNFCGDFLFDADSFEFFV